MSFIQCKDIKEVEEMLGGKGGFVTEDFRVYQEIELWDDACSYKIDSKTSNALNDLKSNIEMMSEGGFEQSFLDLERNAKELTKSFKAVQKLIKGKPAERVKG